MRTCFTVCVSTWLVCPGVGQAQKSDLPSDAAEGMRHLYDGDADRAIAFFRRLQLHQPERPLGYLLETNALWWKLYCEQCEIQWGFIDAWKRPKLPEDNVYFALADKAISLAETGLKQRETAEMHLYAGMGWALQARLYGLRDDRQGTARAGVKAREHFLRAIKLDPEMADAYTGLGLYNYYVDTLSPLLKLLRFLFGIPGGSKKEGIRQLELAMEKGQLTAVEARFYLAKNLRNYDLQYERAVEVLLPLVAQHPGNAVFQLLLGNLYAKLGRNDQAAAHYRAAQGANRSHAACALRIQQISEAAVKALRGSGL